MTFTSLNPTVTGGAMNTVAVEKTRPADTNAYAANDIICESIANPTLWEFKNLARFNGGSGYIVCAKLTTSQKTNTAKFRITLFHTAPSLVGDNVPNKYLYSDALLKIGTIDLLAMSTGDPAGATGAMTSDFEIRIPFVCDPGTATIYATLEPLDAFVPDLSQKFTIELTADNN